jgi:PAS domain S-box-containing protein
MERELRESTELITQTFRASPDAMIVVNLAGQNIIESNECYDRIFGHAKGGAPGSDGAFLGGWETPADVGRILELLKTQGFIREFEARRRTAAGAVVVNLISAEKLELGSLQCAVMVFRDITGWKNAGAATALLEAQLRQSQKLEAIGRLAGGIAHDFNNILAAIMGNSQLADMDLEEGHPAKENIRQTLTAAIRARELISQILVFSRRGDERREPTRLNDFVRDSLRLLRATVPTTIKVVLTLPETVPDVLANPTQLLQVLLNLTANAVHSMEAAGGRLELTVAEVEAAVGLELGPSVLVQVRDTGCGMDNDVLEHIFEPFFTTKEAGEGTGLGLATVHGIVKQHGGHVEVKSAPGQGTSFMMYFPVCRASSTPAAAPITIPPRDLSIGRGKCVMVLDDEVGVGDTIEKVLKRFGYTVEAFAEPTAALAAFRESPDRYSLVITDLTMPQMKGTAVAEAIWRLKQGIPILLITGFNNAAELESYRDMGLRGPLRKPFLAEALVAAVAECLPPKT